MDENTRSFLILAVIFGVLGGRELINRFRGRQYEKGGRPPMPNRRPWATEDKIQRTEGYIAQLQQVPWGQNPVTDQKTARALFEKGYAIVYDASGENYRLEEAISAFVHCPPALAYTGAAEVMRMLSYIGGAYYTPNGIYESERYTDLALQADPDLVDAWLTRALVFTTYSPAPATHPPIAKYALNRVRKSAPTHSRLPRIEAAYYKMVEQSAKQEKALQQAVQLAPSPSERKSLLNTLGLLLLARRRPKKALLIFQQLTTEYPDFAWAWHNQSLVFMRLHRYQEALDSSERALSIFEFPRARMTNTEIRKKLGLPGPLGG